MVLFVIATYLSLSLSQENPCTGNLGRLLPNPNNCFSYTQCILSNPQTHECPEGEVFAENRCVPGNRDTCEADSLEQICAGVFFGARAYPSDPKLFVACIKGIGTLESCNEDEMFDVEVNRCVAQRTLNPCENHPGQTIINEDDCSQFIVCALIIPRFYQCPNRMIYSEEQNRCVVGSSDTCQVTEVTDICRGIFFEAFPHPDSDLVFVGCSRGNYTILPCPEPKRFESMTGECV